MIYLLLAETALIVGLWHTWSSGGDGQAFYRAMGWAHPAIVGRKKRR